MCSATFPCLEQNELISLSQGMWCHACHSVEVQDIAALALRSKSGCISGFVSGWGGPKFLRSDIRLNQGGISITFIGLAAY